MTPTDLVEMSPEKAQALKVFDAACREMATTKAAYDASAMRVREATQRLMDLAVAAHEAPK